MTTTFSAIDLTSRHPEGVCAACAVHGLRHASGALFVFCEHSHTGAFATPDEDWHLLIDTTLAEFQREILSAVLTLEAAHIEAAADDVTLQ